MDKRVISEEKTDGIYPMFIGVSCAFFALRLLPEPEISDEKWSEIRNRLLQCSAHLLGWVVWRAQREEPGKSHLLRKLDSANKQIQELKKRRSEDAKANEKVVGIVSAREQRWLDERKRLRQHIDAVMSDLRVLEMKNDKAVSELNGKSKEMEAALRSRDRSLEEEERKRSEMEGKLHEAESLVAELRENIVCEAQRHSSEIIKHKTAVIELVSNQRQLEAEMGRALRQVEAAKLELDSVSEQKEQSVLMAQRLSMELVKIRKDSEQKDQVLSAMLRKSKLDTDEKQMLLKEAKKKQAVLETARLKAGSVSKTDRHSLKNMLSKSHLLSGSKALHARGMMSLDAGSFRSVRRDYHIEYEPKKGSKLSAHLPDVEPSENWADSEAEKYKIVVEQRHRVEIEAFVDQLRIKDEKLEASHWLLLNMEIESKKLQSQVEALDHDISQLKQDNVKLKAVLLEREAELRALKEQFNSPIFQKMNKSALLEAATTQDTVWSKVKIIKRNPGQKKQELKVVNEEPSEIHANKQRKDVVWTVQRENIESVNVASSETLPSTSQELSKKNNWKIDIHALGVSYKIKRLKQQLLMLERLTGKQESGEHDGNDNVQCGVKGFYALMSLLNKQVDRYQSLQTKNDDLCKRMSENNINLNSGTSTIAKTGNETKRLEHFLEETFQLQRYIVATGQKLLEVQAKIASGFAGEAESVEKPATFDMKRFADSIRSLFQEVQRGLEVRISRIIGDLEGTLACDGIIHVKKQLPPSKT